jgi:glutamate racemase
VVESAARRAARACPSGHIAVIATEAAIRSHRYEAALKAEAPRASVLSVPCPSLVPLAEEGRTDEDALGQVAHALSPLLSHPPDALLLGCTHFVRLSPLFARLLPRTVLIDAGEAAARDLARTVPDRGQGRLWVFISRDKEAFDRSAEKLSVSGYPGAVLIKNPRVPL